MGIKPNMRGLVQGRWVLIFFTTEFVLGSIRRTAPAKLVTQTAWSATAMPLGYSARIVAITVFECGSILKTDWPLSPALVTQTDPSPTATQHGHPPTGM